MMYFFEHDGFRLLVSLVLGSVIGLEREVSDKAAGLRTNVLICVGATLFTIISGRFTTGSDPARIAAQIVSGIGFLGAGAIMREGDRITGLTTAATIWTVAAIGTAVGYGFFTIACLTTVLILFIQLVLTKFDILIDDWRQRHTFRITSKFDDKSIEEIRTIFRGAHIKVLRQKLMKRNSQFYSEWYTSGPRLHQGDVVRKLLESKEVIEVTY